eukprot:2564099-Rhodomonas_salina.1
MHGTAANIVSVASILGSVASIIGALLSAKSNSSNAGAVQTVLRLWVIAFDSAPARRTPCFALCGTSRAVYPAQLQSVTANIYQNSVGTYVHMPLIQQHSVAACDGLLCHVPRRNQSIATAICVQFVPGMAGS